MAYRKSQKRVHYRKECTKRLCDKYMCSRSERRPLNLTWNHNSWHKKTCAPCFRVPQPNTHSLIHWHSYCSARQKGRFCFSHTNKSSLSNNSRQQKRERQWRSRWTGQANKRTDRPHIPFGRHVCARMIVVNQSLYVSLYVILTHTARARPLNNNTRA